MDGTLSASLASRDGEIARAASGEQFYGGFLRESQLAAAKEQVARLVAQLNQGEAVLPAEVAAALAAFEA